MLLCEYRFIHWFGGGEDHQTHWQHRKEEGVGRGRGKGGERKEGLRKRREQSKREGHKEWAER
jgi:hypothetical protein